jgi:toxin ParE1/3/4
VKLVSSPRAELDLEEIGDYIALDNPSRAISFVLELEEHCQKISKRPAAFPLRDDIAATIRMAVHGNYLIFFRILDRNVRVERIIHGGRNVSHAGLDPQE